LSVVAASAGEMLVAGKELVGICHWWEDAAADGGDASGG